MTRPIIFTFILAIVLSACTDIYAPSCSTTYLDGRPYMISCWDGRAYQTAIFSPPSRW